MTGVRAGERGVSHPRYIGGERSGPPENCGGIPGFYQLLEVLANPAHPDHAFLKEWAGDYDPDTLDALPIKYASVASQTVVTPPEPASPRKSPPPRPDYRE